MFNRSVDSFSTPSTLSQDSALPRNHNCFYFSDFYCVPTRTITPSPQDFEIARAAGPLTSRRSAKLTPTLTTLQLKLEPLLYHRGRPAVAMGKSGARTAEPITTSTHRRAKKGKKTYNTRDSLVITDPTTSLALARLSRGERTGSRVLQRVWSYVTG
ncbi:hypothetical protein B0T16DRAFT_100923 [Cercophora newfieldiana]|uniref:Uncharacterized protein n=1 Tax=Cercophora newfieldiana TaxID=92897 RepID=A0AA39YIY9_9PEZI|nr:hypothetical protein B0T16DRAFT_100923 [Cercophora newfieldiana]